MFSSSIQQCWGTFLDSFSYHFQPPLDLARFVAEQNELDLEIGSGDIFLYHGTNCFRRWEIKRCGIIEPGRSHYSFFCTKVSTALTYGRAACLRDMANHNINSLICEPVVLRVRFNKRTWMQVDFWQAANPSSLEKKGDLSLAVLGPISTDFIVDVLYCSHGRRLRPIAGDITSLAEGTLFNSIQQLREKLIRRRPEVWVIRKLGIFSQNVNTRLSGGQVPALTFADNLRRLRQVRA